LDLSRIQLLPITHVILSPHLYIPLLVYQWSQSLYIKTKQTWLIDLQSPRWHHYPSFLSATLIQSPSRYPPTSILESEGVAIFLQVFDVQHSLADRFHKSLQIPQLPFSFPATNKTPLVLPGYIANLESWALISNYSFKSLSPCTYARPPCPPCHLLKLEKVFLHSNLSLSLLLLPSDPFLKPPTLYPSTLIHINLC